MQALQKEIVPLSPSSAHTSQRNGTHWADLFTCINVALASVKLTTVLTFCCSGLLVGHNWVKEQTDKLGFIRGSAGVSVFRWKNTPVSITMPKIQWVQKMSIYSCAIMAMSDAENFQSMSVLKHINLLSGVLL